MSNLKAKGTSKYVMPRARATLMPTPYSALPSLDWLWQAQTNWDRD